MPASSPIESRFWPRLVTQPNGCMEWSGARLPKGYGMVRWQQKHWHTNRVAWVLTFGPIPDGMCVLHRCDNPPCCNPEHLFLGTVADNNADRSAKGRSHAQNVTHCPKGHPYDDVNTYIHPNNGARGCKICRRDAVNRSYARRKNLIHQETSA